MASSMKLKPCPFCGAEGKIIKGENKYPREVWYHACCSNLCCELGCTHSRKTDAVNAWNRRAGENK